MPHSIDPLDLRAKAKMLRRAAAMLNWSPWSDRLREIAKGLDARADELEGRPAVRDP